MGAVEDTDTKRLVQDEKMWGGENWGVMDVVLVGSPRLGHTKLTGTRLVGSQWWIRGMTLLYQPLAALAVIHETHPRTNPSAAEADSVRIAFAVESLKNRH